MKTKTFTKSTTLNKIKTEFNNGLVMGFIKGTDCVIVKSDYILYVYSKRMHIHGCEGYNKVCKNLKKLGYNGYYKLYYNSDWESWIHYMNAETWSDDDYAKTKKTAIKALGAIKQRPEYGVELEIESPDYMSSATKNELAIAGGDLIQDVGNDGSVHYGCEIRFNHPRMSGWKYKDVSKILKLAKSKGCTTEGGTAGMHVHISHTDIDKIVKRFRENLPVMQEILYPINCRKLKKADGDSMYFGVNDNIYHDQRSDFGTLEIRAWNSTLDPRLFLARIKFCKTLTNWLSKTTEISIKSFFGSMTAEEKSNYRYMLFHKENPHEWGFDANAINTMLA